MASCPTGRGGRPALNETAIRAGKDTPFPCGLRPRSGPRPGEEALFFAGAAMQSPASDVRTLAGDCFAAFAMTGSPMASNVGIVTLATTGPMLYLPPHEHRRPDATRPSAPSWKPRGGSRVVGASAKPWRPSHGVMRFLLDCGYDVTPVNPGLAGQAIHDRPVVGRLNAAAPLEMVDVFRNSAHVGARGGRRDPAWRQRGMDAAWGDRPGGRGAGAGKPGSPW